MTALLSAPHTKPSYDRSSSGGEGTGRPVAERFGDTRDHSGAVINIPLVNVNVATHRVLTPSACQKGGSDCFSGVFLPHLKTSPLFKKVISFVKKY